MQRDHADRKCGAVSERPEGGSRAGLTALLVGAVGLGVLGAGASASAQEAPKPTSEAPQASEAGSSSEIIVTARRRDERLIDVPVAITAVQGSTLDKLAVTRFTDLATLVPTLVAGRAASGSSASIFLRGVGSTALSAGFDQSVSFLVDGLPMSRGREISFAQYDVARVEVLKGPQALYFGKNTTGGLIAVVTNGPGKTFEAGFKAGYGFEGNERYGEGFVSGPLSDALRARLAFRVSDSDGAFDNTAAPTSTTPLGFSQHRVSDKRGSDEVESARLTVVYEPTSKFNLELKLGATHDQNGGPTDFLERICGNGRTTPATANGVPPSPNADCRINGRSDLASLPSNVAATWRYARNGDIYADIKTQYAVLTGNLSLDKLDIQSISSFYTFKQEDLNDVAGEAYPASFSQYAKFNQTAEELRFTTKLDGPLNFMFGAFASTSDFTFNTDAYIFNVPFDPINKTFVTFRRDDGFDGDTLSFFGEGNYEFNDQWELSAGARWSRETRDSFQQSLPGHIAFAAAFPGNIRLNDKFSDENVSPQATLRYKPSRDVSYYVAYKEGFKSGGFNISQSLTPAASVKAGQFGSETAKGEEAGVRALLFGRQLAVNATIYDYLYEGLQVQNFDPVTIGQVVANAGQLRTRGIEGDFNWAPDAVPGLSIRGAAAYNDAKYDKYIGQCYSGQTIAQGCNLVPNAGAFTSQNYSGRTPPKAPDFAGRLGASYEFPLFQSLRAEVGGDVSYTAKYNFTDTLRPDAVQPAYTKLDLTARVMGPGDRWTLSLIGRNLTQEYVVTSANDIPFTGGTGTGTTVGKVSDMSAFVENPREVYVEVAVKF